MVSGAFDTWFITQLLWSHLHSDARKAVRATCRTGRRLHDYLCDSLAIKPRQKAPMLKDMKRTLMQLSKYSAKLTSLRIHQEDEASVDVKQTLLAVRLCSNPLLTSLTLEGEFPFTSDIGSAIAAHCPNLTHLALRYLCPDESTFVHSGDPVWKEQGEVLGQLLESVGPRLKQLELDTMPVWHSRACDALSSCTALESLRLRVSEFLTVPVPIQEGLLSTIGQLTQLRSLSLEYECCCYLHEEGVPHHDTSSLRHLSTLTRLTCLDLNLHHYETRDDRWMAGFPFLAHDESYDHWQRLWPEQRAALVKALRLMPHLTAFSSRILHMCASDLAVLPSSVTRVSLGRLLPEPILNPPAQPLSASAYRGQPSTPQQQQGDGVQLVLQNMAPVGVLASVHQHWPALTSVAQKDEGRVDLFFGTLDMVPGTSTLLPHTQGAVRRAVQTVLYGSSVPAGQQEGGAPCSAGAAGAGERKIAVLGVRADALRGLALAPQLEVNGQAQGHAAWIRELAPLARPGHVVDFKGFKFEPVDVLALVDTFPGAKAVLLHDSRIPMGALPCLGQLRGLEEVHINLAKCADATAGTLEAALLGMCCTAPTLQRVKMWNQVPDFDSVLERVRQALASSGRRAVELHYRGERR